MTYAAYVFCITSLGAFIHMSIIDGSIQMASILPAIGTGMTCVGAFFLYRYLAQRELTD